MNLALVALFAGDLAFWHWSILDTSVANSTLLANLATLFVALAAWLIWKQRPSRRFLTGLAAALLLPVALASGEALLPQSPEGWLVLLGLAGIWLARRGSKQHTPGRPGPRRSHAEP